MLWKGVFCFALFASVHGESRMRVADDDEFPFQVSVKDLRRNVSICSGALITPTTVLSTASCLENHTEVKVSAGSIRLSRQNQTVTYQDIILHPGYRRNQTSNNIALIKLGYPFNLTKYVQLVMIPVKGTPLVNHTTLSGWNLVHVDDSIHVVDNYTLWKKGCGEKFNLMFGEDEFCGEDAVGDENGLPAHGSLVSKDGVLYGLQSRVQTSRNLQRFLEVSDHAGWINETLQGEGSQVQWHSGRNQGTTPPCNCVAATLLLALFLCQ